MSVVILEHGALVLMARYVHQKKSGGVYYFRRRIPDRHCKQYPNNSNGLLFFSLKTKDPKEAAKLAHREALRQDAHWKALDEGTISNGPYVVRQFE